MNDTLTESISRRFSQPELAELDSVRHAINESKSFGTLELLTGWAHNVAKIDADRIAQPSDSRAWGGYDLVGALSLRDFLQGCIDRLAEPVRSKVVASTEEFDQQFRSITMHDENHLIEQFTDGGLAAAPWWWHRVPGSGPLLADLLESQTEPMP